MSLAVLILAAGKGTRMNSEVPKVLHKIQNRSLIRTVVNNAKALNPRKIVVVTGYRSESVQSELNSENVEFVLQEEQLGTGHAVLSAKKELRGFSGSILILSGDVPSADAEILNKFLSFHCDNSAKISLITANSINPYGYGRVVRSSNGRITSIIEEKDANENQKKINEINSGIYIIESDCLWQGLDKLDSNNNQGEYYLPGIIEYGVDSNLPVAAFQIDDCRNILGVNTRYELIELEKYMNEKTVSKHLNNGVTIIDPATTFISDEVQIGKDTIIKPNTYIYGKSSIGSNSVIGPSVYIEDSTVGNNVEIRFSSYLNSCNIEDGVVMGPFSHLRPETLVKMNAKIGNFVEIKKSTIGEGSKVPHLSYVGDATLGKNVNIGAGTITCNYDGVSKHRTIIEDNVFIGSDSMLVAPVRIGKNATTAAGSTITKDVEPGSLAIERSTQKEIKGWSERKRRNKES